MPEGPPCEGVTKRQTVFWLAVVRGMLSPPDNLPTALHSEYYIYDGSGNRVRKITVANGVVIEKIYLGGVEIKRINTASSLKLERYDHHVMDDTSRIAIVNHWMQDDFLRETDSPSDLNKNKIRYQYGNHLGSASLELNDTGALISYEEYFPYGGTSFTCGTSQKEVKLKEYRYTGKERDEATGLYYYGARYYAAWLGRWLSADPAGPVDGLNLYEYVRGNPVGLVDPDGRESWNHVSFSNEEDPDWLKPDGSFIAAVPSEWEVRFYSAWAEARNLFADDGLLSFECIKRDYERVQGEKRKLEVERQRFWLAQLEARGRITDTWQGSLGLIIAASQDGFRDGCWNYDKWVVRGERYATGINVGLMVVGGVAAAKSGNTNVAGNISRKSATYSGVREASSYLKKQGVPREARKEILESFDVRTIKVRKSSSSEFGVRYFDGINAQARGRFLFETFPASRNSIALRPDWNQMTGIKQWKIREGSTLIEGNALPQGIGLKGGQIQKFVPYLGDLLE
ncbi:putative insecticidal toxin protein [Chitinispirillum alkaliphilum]|nr:putative insecticidal toxin protein [Chitinispirillum alkaliphilum]